MMGGGHVDLGKMPTEIVMQKRASILYMERVWQRFARIKAIKDRRESDAELNRYFWDQEP